MMVFVVFVKKVFLSNQRFLGTLNSMKKEIPKAYEPAKYEDEIYKKWEKSDAFNPDKLKLSENAKSYTISMPPPNVTGTLHMGHAVMLAIEDILTRYHRMKGERVLWVPGTDHAAIATQTKVEKILKEEGVDRHKLGREKFLARVNKFAQESHDTIVNQVKKMGSSCDWSREAYTLDEIRTRAVRTVFKMMYDDGLIYRGERIVNWCPRCHSTLADDEVEYKAQKAKLYTFKYDKNFPIAISTTRPETKLGDTAVAVNPKDERYKKYVGKELAADFCGVKLKLKIIADKEVDMNFGTGAVGVTPAHSIVDWKMAENHNLEIIKVIDEDGNIRDGFGEYSGKNVFQARKIVVEKLRENNLIIKEEEIDNNLSLCYRCDTPIEPLPSLQWFIDVNKKIPRYKKSLKELSIEAVKKGVFGREKINIIPERFEKNYFHWMDNLRDWCISRQIWFGHQVPVWYKKTINNPEDSGLTINNNKENIYVGIESPEGEDWVQDPDTLDTWFSSGLWTFSTLAKKAEDIKIKNGKLFIEGDDFKNFHPTAVLETGYDILFFWVARMIIMTTYAVGDIPFQDVYLHGLVRDEKGKKMSKSLGNVIDPLDMIKKYGTDAVRLSLVVGTTPGNDMNLSEEKVAGFRNFANKLWNISRYIITNYESRALGITNYEFDQKELSDADKYILEKMRELVGKVTNDLNEYNFSQAGEKLREFTWTEFADWYLEVSKFEKSKEKSKILFYILENLLKLWHPFMPFVTEVIWSNFKKDLIMVSEWPTLIEIKNFNLENNFQSVKDAVAAIRNARAENKIEPAKKIKAVLYGFKAKKITESQEVLIKNLRTGISELEIIYKTSIPQKDLSNKDDINISTSFGELLLKSVVNKEKEKERIKKEIENLEKIIKSTETKLNNKEFVERAPEKVVNMEKEKLASAQSELKKLKK
jgi:valyl-tRNA synthetase